MTLPVSFSMSLSSPIKRSHRKEHVLLKFLVRASVMCGLDIFFERGNVGWGSDVVTVTAILWSHRGLAKALDTLW